MRRAIGAAMILAVAAAAPVAAQDRLEDRITVNAFMGPGFVGENAAFNMRASAGVATAGIGTFLLTKSAGTTNPRPWTLDYGPSTIDYRLNRSANHGRLRARAGEPRHTTSLRLMLLSARRADRNRVVFAASVSPAGPRLLLFLGHLRHVPSRLVPA